MWRIGLLCLFCTLLAEGTTVYKVVRKDGTVVYTDRPVNGQSSTLVKPGNIAVMPGYSAALAPKVKKVSPQSVDYQLAVFSPAPEQHIRDNSGNLVIEGTLNPAASGQFQLWLNGMLQMTEPQPRFALSNLPRGEYQLQIHFIQKSGKILASSPVQQFYLHRASVLNRPAQ